MKTTQKAKFLVILPLIVAAGCWEKKSSVEVKGDDTVLITMGGKPVMTRSMCEEEFNKLIAENPQYKAIFEMMPDAKIKFLEGQAQLTAIDEWAKRQGIASTKEYKADLENAINAWKKMLNQKYFVASLKIEMPDAELQKFYDENKDKAQDWVIARGGVTAVGVKFSSEADAKAFLAKAKEGFEKAAKAANLSIEDFKVVHAGSMIDPKLRVEIMQLKKFPSVELIKVNDKAFYVVHATGKSDKTEYKSFEEVKDQIKKYLDQVKRQELVTAETAKLIKEYAIEVNKEALMPKAEAQPEAPKAEEAPKAPEAKEAPAAPAAA